MKQIIIIFFLLISLNADAQLYWNQAGSFAGGSNSYVSFPNAGGINVTDEFTLECWVYPLSTGAGNRYLIFKKDGASATYYTGINSSNKFIVGTSPGITRLVSNSSIPLNKWTHVAAMYDGAFHIYINGAVDNVTGAVNFPAGSSTDSLLIGKGGSNSGFHGLIDEVRIWNTARTIVSGEHIGRTMRSTVFANTGDYSNVKFSLPFQRSRYNAGIEFDLENVITGANGLNNGITARSFTNQPSEYLALNTCLSLLSPGSFFAWVNNGVNLDLTSAFTVEAWISQVNNDNVHPVISKMASNNGYKLVINNGEIVYSINGVNIFTGVSVPENEWHHIAWTRSTAGVSKIYLDGTLRHTEAGTPAPVTNPDSLIIGKDQGNGFWGHMDELRISKFEKAQAQIQKYMFSSIDEVNQPAGTNVCWNFDGPLGSSTGNGTVRLAGNTSLSNTSVTTNTGPNSAPTVRNDNGNYPNGYRTKNSFKDLASNIIDSLAINESTPISDINIFLAFSANEEYLNSIRVTLIAPNNDSTIVMANFIYRDTMFLRTHVILDEQADSIMTTNKYVFLGPRMKPAGTLSAFTGDNPNGIWKIRIRRTSGSGSGGDLLGWGLQINNSTLVGVEENTIEQPFTYKLEQNYPNPFNPVTTINYQLTMPNIVKLKVYDINGKLVKVLVNEKKPAGKYSATFDGTGLASGVYFYKLETDAFTDVKKMIFIK